MRQSFRANEQNNNSAVSKWDFIAASNQSALVLQDAGKLIGEQPDGKVFQSADRGQVWAGHKWPLTCGFRWWGGRGSNPRPMDYESTALTD